MDAIRLIVNADDLGLDTAVNEGILGAHESGIVTSTSLMVRRPAAADGAARARRAPDLSVGLHYDMGEWERHGDAWTLVGASARPDDEASVEADVAGQLERFESLMGRPPTHLDSHQHVHLDGPARTVLTRTAERIGIPLRHFTAGVRYDGSFYGRTRHDDPAPDAIGVAALLRLLDSLGPGTTELCCHPSTAAVAGSAYAAERTIEYESLRDPAVVARIRHNSIRLLSFAQLASGVVAA